MDSIFGYYYRPPTLAESIMEGAEILPTGTVQNCHRWSPYVRSGLRYRGRKREGGVSRLARQIRFRGKRIDNGKWVYGHYLQSASSFIAADDGIVDGHWDIQEVDPATVGQFTGLKDKNRRRIYEGDILDHYATMGHVLFEDGMFCLSTSAKVNFGEYRQPLCYIDTAQAEIIGNIHDNPSLLK